MTEMTLAQAFARRKAALHHLQHVSFSNGKLERKPEHQAKVDAAREAYYKADALYAEIRNKGMNQ